MKRATFFICVVAGFLLLIMGLLIPAHLRAVDTILLQSAGEKTDGTLKRGRNLADENRLGAAKLFVDAARAAEISGWDRLGETVTNLAEQNPTAIFWGNDAHAESLFGNTASQSNAAAFFVREKNREIALAYLTNAPDLQELLRTRSLNSTALFPSPQSAARQPYETALCLCGLLLEEKKLSPDLSAEILTNAFSANHGGGSLALENNLMGLLSLAERFNWDQLTAFTEKIPDAKTLNQLAGEIQIADDNLPILFASVQLSEDASGVAKYISNFGPAAWNDLKIGLRSGAGGMDELAAQQKKIYDPNWENPMKTYDPFASFFFATAKFSLHRQTVAFAVRCVCFLLAGFFFVAAWRALQNESPQERALRARGFRWFRGLLFSAGFLFVVLLLSEPFLAQENRQENFFLRPHLPMAGGAARTELVAKQNFMNPTILLTLLIFFVLQALIYIACVAKLAEIRRQNAPPRIKLKLLENEEHLFDAGLYLGFVGTIVSLIIASLGLVKFSLMAAYSSTSFGIIFVVIFKIFQLRPAKRKLLLEAETQNFAAEKNVPPRPNAILPS